jgi:DNA-binding NarL/FixJ family response regulator
MNKVLIIQETNECNSISSSDNCIVWNYHDLRNSFNNSPEEWTSYDSEYPSFKAAEKAKDEGFKLIFVSSEIDTWPLLILHILLNRSEATCHLISQSKDVRPFLKKDMGLFKNGVIKLFTLEDVESFLKTPGEVERLMSVFKRDFIEDDFLDSIIFTDKIDKHQITNEWGANKLLLNAGYLSGDIAYRWPQTIYFKYLINKQESTPVTATDRGQILTEFGLNPLAPLTFAPLLTKKKILLIDDNADKGWSIVLSKVFGIPVNAVEVKRYKSEVIGGSKCLIRPNDYDIIFLDLRLPSVERQTPDMQNGIDIIDIIKAAYPAVPLIVFTASQRASTLDSVLEHGADGMYVKESPQYVDEENYSKENFKDFVRTISEVLSKYKILRSYWECIVKIRSGYLNEIADLPNRGLFKSRIEERLLMFYGLLKKGFDEWDYDKNSFYYKPEAIAFMVLWSVLNEIQEALYEKELSTLDIFYNGALGGYTPLKKRDRTEFKFVKRWSIKNQPHDLYFEKTNFSIRTKDSGGFKTDSNGDFILDYSTKTHLNFVSHTTPYYRSRDSYGNYVEGNISVPDTRLAFQIAFLILEKTQFKSSSKTNRYLEKLKIANEVRNKLFLTHGEESTSTSFYSMLEKDKTFPTNAIEELFELIAFLLTGDDTIEP